MNGFKRTMARALVVAVAVLGSVTVLSGPAHAAHPCTAAKTTGAKVCVYQDTWTFAVCDTAADGHHATVRFEAIYSDGDRDIIYYHETSISNGQCGKERLLPSPIASYTGSFDFIAQVWEGHSQLIREGPAVHVDLW